MLQILPIVTLLALLSASGCTSDRASDAAGEGSQSAAAVATDTPTSPSDDSAGKDAPRQTADAGAGAPLASGISGGGDAPAKTSSPGDGVSDAPETASGRRVTILDHGFRMARGTEVIPNGWTLRQDVATDPMSARVVRYHLEIRGPGGALIKGLATVPYGPVVGVNLFQALNGMVANALGAEIEGMRIGEVRRSALLERTPQFQKAVRLVQGRGMQVEALEAPLSGRRNGEAVAGVVFFGHFSSLGTPGMGTINGSVVVAPPKRLEEAIRVHERITHSYRANPQFEQRLSQVHASAMQRSNAAHQQRMADSRSRFNARQRMMQNRFETHQNIMKDRYQANDRQHQQWMESYRNSGSSAWAGSDYTGHDALVDGIHEQTSFLDPYSGQQVDRAGQYDYWYTNGLGDYYGTDDPSFDPDAMDGNWQQIEPLRPTP